MGNRGYNEIQQPFAIARTVDKNSNLIPASIVRRVSSFIIDTVVIHVILLGFIISFSATSFLVVAGGMFYDVGNISATQEEETILVLGTIFGIISVTIGLLLIFLYLFLPQWKLNRTLGQKLLGLQIQNQFDRSRLSFKQAFLRLIFPLLWEVTLVIPVWLQYAGLVVILVDCGWYFFRPGKQTLHDFLSNTNVVRI